jgi:hypothetical protein
VVPGVLAPQTHVRPPLTAWAEPDFIVGALSNEPDNLIRWIKGPQEIADGSLRVG